MYNHNKAQQSKNRVHISWDILYVPTHCKDLLSQSLKHPANYPRWECKPDTRGLLGNNENLVFSKKIWGQTSIYFTGSPFVSWISISAYLSCWHGMLRTWLNTIELKRYHEILNENYMTVEKHMMIHHTEFGGDVLNLNITFRHFQKVPLILNKCVTCENAVMPDKCLNLQWVFMQLLWRIYRKNYNQYM